MDESRVKDVGSLLAAFFDEEKLRRGGRYAQFFESWRAVVGERLAAHSRVVDLEKGILIVEAEHPGWIQLLQLRQTQTLDSLSARFPDLSLRGIAFRLAGAEYSERNKRPSPEAESAQAAEISATEGEAMTGTEEVKIGRIPSEEGRDSAFEAALSSLKKAINGGKGK